MSFQHTEKTAVKQQSMYTCICSTLSATQVVSTSLSTTPKLSLHTQKARITSGQCGCHQHQGTLNGHLFISTYNQLYMYNVLVSTVCLACKATYKAVYLWQSNLLSWGPLTSSASPLERVSLTKHIEKRLSYNMGLNLLYMRIGITCDNSYSHAQPHKRYRPSAHAYT